MITDPAMEPSLSDQLARERTELAETRTAMAAERTLMAWIRTALGMISFGFTIYKFMHALVEANTIHFRTNSPRTLGIFLAALGTGALVAGTIEYVRTMRAMGGRSLGFTFYVGCAVIALGLMVLLGILIRIGPFH